jgi:hypothetical protein
MESLAQVLVDRIAQIAAGARWPDVAGFWPDWAMAAGEIAENV